MRRNRLILMLLLGALAVAVVLSIRGSGNKGKEGAGAPAQEVQVIALEQQTVDVSEEFPARATAYMVSEVRPQVGGIVQRRYFAEGALVKQGQPLYQIDSATYEASYQSAKASLIKAQATVKSAQAKSQRYQGLVKMGAVSRQDYDDAVASYEEAKADVGVAEAALNQAKINLGYTKVYAPISGRISKSSVTPGALVSAQQAEALATITQLDPIYIDIAQSADDMQRLRDLIKRDGTQIIKLFDANGTALAQQATLQFTDITVDPTTGAVQLRALAKNPKHEILPGMFLRARLELQRENSLTVPQKATTRKPDGILAVWRIKEDMTVESATVVARQTIGDQWLVLQGLEAGDRIVVEGMSKLKDGAKVSIPEEKTAEEIPAEANADAEPGKEKP